MLLAASLGVQGCSLLKEWQWYAKHGAGWVSGSQGRCLLEGLETFKLC
jgi:hypothetical protein